eukprot:scaffold65950_cov62-Phaeocystis_antarctica.AAC.5
MVDRHERDRVPIAKRLAVHLQRLAIQQLSRGEVALDLQQVAEGVDGVERARMPAAERLAPHDQHLALQRLGGGEVALVQQQLAEIGDGAERVRMPISEQLAEVVDGGKRVRVSTAERPAVRLQRLAVQWLGLVEHALGLQLLREGVQGEAYVLPVRSLGLESCTQQLDAQRVAVVVPALAAAVGCVLPRAHAPPSLEAVLVDPLDGAAAGARLHERAVVLALQAHPAPRLVLLLASALAFGAWNHVRVSRWRVHSVGVSLCECECRWQPRSVDNR